MPSTAILWFRRDLRVHDHPALAAATAAADHVVPVFVIDDALLAGRWPAPNRAWFMRESVVALSDDLAERGAALRVLRGRPTEALTALARETGATDVFLTRDATPYGRARDRAVVERLAEAGVTVHAKRGLYVHEPDEVVTRDGRPYTVYGPFRRAWEAMPGRAVLPAPDRIAGPAGARPDPVPDLGAPSADPALIPPPGEAAARARLDAWVARRVEAYSDRRDRLDADEGTSRLSQDLRWGLLSPVEILERASGPGDGRRVFANEVAWREFYAHVLWHHPRVLREPFQAAFAALPWRDDPEALEAWREGRTGYPVVDAAMRQLRASGFVHNRARMIAASFLTKHLLADWRLGEAEFMRHLTDGDVASNNGGWQWTASTGTDPQPYFRVFNPILQGRRFDPDGAFVRRWVPELHGIAGGAIHEPWLLDAAAQAAAGVRIGTDYPAPIVEHAAARERAIAVYGATRAAARDG
ncbi:MAG TPA: deoxyribodipyrimidine photo-lyase [Candidatus Limnocylindrales bacterium]|nr:deoxyribodipyrimidine photo-lyase [Candidatus Limnocylindrales bacterium]